MNIRLKTDIRGRPPKPFKRGKYYHCRLRIAGQDVWRSLKTTNKRKAESLAYLLWYQQQTTELQALLDTPPVLLSQVWEWYEDSEVYRQGAESTQLVRLRRWNQLCNWCESRGVTTTDDITSDVCRLFLRSCKKAKNFNNVLSDIKRVWEAGCKELRLTNPWATIEWRSIVADEPSDYRALEIDEVKQLLSALSVSKVAHRDEWTTAVIAGYYTGLRYKDIVHLTVQDVLGSDCIELTPFKTKRLHKTVLIAVAEPFRAHVVGLGRVGPICPNLLAKYSEGANNTKPINMLMHRIGIVNRASFHSLRSTFTTLASRHCGVSEELLGGALGHTTKAQTAHYNKNAISINLSKLPQIGVP